MIMLKDETKFDQLGQKAFYERCFARLRKEKWSN